MEKLLNLVPRPPLPPRQPSCRFDSVKKTHKLLKREEWPELLAADIPKNYKVYWPRSGTGDALVHSPSGQRVEKITGSFAPRAIASVVDGKLEGYIYSQPGTPYYKRIVEVRGGTAIRFWSVCTSNGNGLYYSYEDLVHKKKRSRPSKNTKKQLFITNYVELKKNKKPPFEYRMHGLYVSAGLSGALHQIGMYREGLRCGTWRFYDAGTPTSVNNYEIFGSQSLLHGLQEGYYVFGDGSYKLSSRHNCDRGKKVGLYIEFNVNGDLRVLQNAEENAIDTTPGTNINSALSAAGLEEKYAKVKRNLYRLAPINLD